ncbi:MAG: hypothetical protein ABIQ95_07690 [Bdellovibrionia bacterium]
MNKNFSPKEMPKEWADDYKTFVSTNEIQPPIHLYNKILERVHSDLNPPPWIVFSRLSLIHTVVGTITLLFCPQFGFSPLSDWGLMNVFMQFGEVGCMLGCGAVYSGSSALAASFLLKQEEMRVLRRTEALQIPLLGLLSIGAFLCFGASIVFGMTIIAWLFGSILGGMATLELGWWIRSKFQAIN